MNRIIIFLITFSPLFSLFSQSNASNESISIYHDINENLFGRSLYRNIITTVNDLEFKRTATHYINNSNGYFVTAVTIDKASVDYLNSITLNDLPLMLGEYEIRVDHVLKRNITDRPVYRFTSRRTGLDLIFSAIEAPPQMLSMIEEYYHDDQVTLELVSNYYKENYVIAIFASENVFNQQNYDITLADAMLMATLIGDIDQPMWGIHDGNGLLKRVLALKNRE